MLNETIGRHVARMDRTGGFEAPMVETVNQQVRTSMSVPYQRYMRGAIGDAPSVDTVNQQVRTSMSVPFAPYMKADGTSPSVETVNQQVRTSMSVPFAPHMLGQSEATPAVNTVDQQVRTSMSVPFATYMRGKRETAGPGIAVVDQQVRTSMSVPFNPYMLGAHAEELLRRRVMISPVLSVWRFRVKNAGAFKSWLATREMLMSEGRLAGDEEVRGVRYGGTYQVDSERVDGPATFKMIWGYSSESAMLSMQRLCSDTSVTATIVQLDLIDFVKGVKRFIAEAGDKHFEEELLVSTATG